VQILRIARANLRTEKDVVGHIDAVDLREALDLVPVGLAHLDEVGPQPSDRPLADLGDQQSAHGAQRVQQRAVERVQDPSGLAGAELVLVVAVEAALPVYVQLGQDDDDEGGAGAVGAREPQGHGVLLEGEADGLVGAVEAAVVRVDEEEDEEEGGRDEGDGDQIGQQLSDSVGPGVSTHFFAPLTNWYLAKGTLVST